MSTPTGTSYPELEIAFQHLNRMLFAGALPACLITLQRKSPKVRAYYSHNRFINSFGRTTDELAMNPFHFLTRDPLETLSSLCHEMVHVWQQHFGKPGRRGYHNKEWGARMKEIGLYPSNTGEPGGKETGEQMTHYIIPGGAFEQAAKQLLDGGFRFTWAEYVDLPKEEPGEPQADGPPKKEKPAAGRIRFACPKCPKVRAWGKPSLRVLCGQCAGPLVPG